MKYSKVQILTTVLFIILISLIALAQNTNDILLSKLFTSSAVVSGLVIFKLLNNNTLNQKNGQF